MRTKLLFKAIGRRQRGSIACVVILLFLVALSGFSSLTLWLSGERTLSAEMDRLGFGELTVWVNANKAALREELLSHPDVADVGVQPLIFAGYRAGGTYSDNEGQLIVYDGGVPYRFIDADGGEISVKQVEAGKVYVSPAMQSVFGVQIGDEITFELARSNGLYALTIAGYFEDAFMGSSMIDMKSFLIAQSDWETMTRMLESTPDYDVLAHTGAMLHIRQREGSTLSEAQFSRALNTDTDLSTYTAFAYSKDSILSYMLLLENILTGFMLAFSALLLIVSAVVMGHGLSAAIGQDRHDLAVLKTIGLSSFAIRRAYFALYGGSAALALLAGLAPSYLLANALARGMMSSTGLLVHVRFPLKIALPLLLVSFLLLFLLIAQRTAGITRIAPMRTLRVKEGAHAVRSPLHKRGLPLFVALREVLSAKGRYVAVLLIAALLSVFLSIVGCMGAWLGPHGEGLMDAFSVAQHDLGVQPSSERIDMQQIQSIIEAASPIRETYALAMQTVSVNGQDYTANVLDQPQYFHVLEGRVCDPNGILITHTVANALGLSVGDSVQVANGGRRASYTVSGIYQCANGMGTNIGMTREGYARIADVSGYIWCYHYILEDGSVREHLMSTLQEEMRGIDVHTNSWSGLSGIVMVMHLVLAMIYAVSAGFILVTVSLTASKLLQVETGSMAVYKSLGATSARLRLSFSLRFLITVTAGAWGGTVLAAAFSDALIARVFRLFGIGSFTSRVSVLGMVLSPVSVMLLFFGFAWLCSRPIRRVSLVTLIQEN